VPTGSCGAYAVGECHASSSRIVVYNACINRASCSVLAVNAMFGDPCFGTGKRLYVQVTCGGPSGPTVAPASSPTGYPSFYYYYYYDPTVAPSSGPTIAPSSGPTADPSYNATVTPSPGPTAAPSYNATVTPSSGPTAAPSSGPTTAPSSGPTAIPSPVPTVTPSSRPTAAPSPVPSVAVVSYEIPSCPAGWTIYCGCQWSPSFPRRFLQSAVGGEMFNYDRFVVGFMACLMMVMVLYYCTYAVGGVKRTIPIEMTP